MSSTFQPPDKEVVRHDYNTRTNLYSRLMDEVCFSLKREIQARNIELNGEINYRIKKFDSFYNKIVQKQIRGDPFDLIEDIAGVRIICLYRSDLGKIGKIIATNFTVLSSDIKTQRTPSTEFGYMADHYIVKLSEACKGPRYDDLKSIKCEIQIRTILMDAWDSISHHLDYKQEVDIPQNLRRDFYALSGLFYVADTHFEMFRNSVTSLKSKLRKSVNKNLFDLAQEVNLDTIQAYLTWKFPKRARAEKQTYSVLLKNLIDTGYDSFEKINSTTDKFVPALEALEKDQLRKTKEKSAIHGKLRDAPFLRLGFQIFDDNYAKHDILQYISIEQSKSIFKLLQEWRVKYKSLLQSKLI